MFGTLLYILAIWTALSFAVGLTWTILCFARDGFTTVDRSRVRTSHSGKSGSYRVGHRSRSV